MNWNEAQKTEAQLKRRGGHDGTKCRRLRLLKRSYGWMAEYRDSQNRRVSVLGPIY